MSRDSTSFPLATGSFPIQLGPLLLTLWSLGSCQHRLQATKVRFFSGILYQEAVLGLVWVNAHFFLSQFEDRQGEKHAILFLKNYLKIEISILTPGNLVKVP